MKSLPQPEYLEKATILCWKVFIRRDNAVEQTKGERFLGGQPHVAIDGLIDRLFIFTGGIHVNLDQQRARLEDLFGLDLQVGRLALNRPGKARLVDHETRVGRGKAAFRRRAQAQDRSIDAARPVTRVVTGEEIILI